MELEEVLKVKHIFKCIADLGPKSESETFFVGKHRHDTKEEHSLIFP